MKYAVGKGVDGVLEVLGERQQLHFGGGLDCHTAAKVGFQRFVPRPIGTYACEELWSITRLFRGREVKFDDLVQQTAGATEELMIDPEASREIAVSEVSEDEGEDIACYRMGRRIGRA